MPHSPIPQALGSPTLGRARDTARLRLTRASPRIACLPYQTKSSTLETGEAAACRPSSARPPSTGILTFSAARKVCKQRPARRPFSTCFRSKQADGNRQTAKLFRLVGHTRHSCRARATWTRCCVALWQGRIGLPDSPQHVLGSIVGLLAAPRPPALLRLTHPAPPTPSAPPPPPGRLPPSCSLRSADSAIASARSNRNAAHRCASERTPSSHRRAVRCRHRPTTTSAAATAAAAAAAATASIAADALCTIWRRPLCGVIAAPHGRNGR